MRCPHCGKEIAKPMREIRRQHPLTEFRQRLLELADGSRSTREIAQLLGKKVDLVTSTISQMKKQGHPVSTKSRPKRSLEEKMQMLAEARAGMTFKEIGARHGGISGGRVGQIVWLMERREQRRSPKPEMYGPPAPPKDMVWSGEFWEDRS
jgi:transposase